MTRQRASSPHSPSEHTLGSLKQSDYPLAFPIAKKSLQA